MLTDWLLVVVGLLLSLGTGVFVASEFALVNLDRADLEARQARGEGRFGPTISALKVTSTHLSSAQLGITLTTLLTGYTFEPALGSLLEVPLAALGVAEMGATAIASILAIVIATLFSMIFGELVPKNLALALPRQAAVFVMPFQIGFTKVFRPAVAVLNGSANALLRLVGIEPKEELSGARSAEELSSLVRRSALEGTLEQDTATLLGRTLRFNELTAADVMTPRLRMITVERGDPAAAVLEASIRTGYSRFPVTGDEGIDDIGGVVHVKQAVSLPRDRRDTVPVAALQEDALRVPETVHLDALLDELRGAGYQMAVVVDEYGGTAGVVTLEDLVEELVGEVADEHDRSRADVVRGTDSLTFPGMLRPDELLERAGVKVPEEGPYETVAGYVMSELGRLPVVGDEVAVEDGSLRVERLDGRRIDRLRFRATDATEGDASGAETSNEPTTTEATR